MTNRSSKSKRLENTSGNKNKPKRNAKGQLLPGNTANPNGKPPGSISLIAMLKRELENIPKKFQTKKSKKTYAQILIKKVLNKAISKGDQTLIKMIFAYIDGMPKQSIAHEGNIDSTVKVASKKTPKKNQLEDIVKTLRGIGIMDVYKQTDTNN